MGGYIIIDLKNDAFTVGTAKEVKNAWVIFNSDKPVLVYGLKIGTTEYTPFFCGALAKGDGELEGTFGAYVLTINDDNEIEFSEVTED